MILEPVKFSCLGSLDATQSGQPRRLFVREAEWHRKISWGREKSFRPWWQSKVGSMRSCWWEAIGPGCGPCFPRTYLAGLEATVVSWQSFWNGAVCTPEPPPYPEFPYRLDVLLVGSLVPFPESQSVKRRPRGKCGFQIWGWAGSYCQRGFPFPPYPSQTLSEDSSPPSPALAPLPGTSQLSLWVMRTILKHLLLCRVPWVHSAPCVPLWLGRTVRGEWNWRRMCGSLGLSSLKQIANSLGCRCWNWTMRNWGEALQRYLSNAQAVFRRELVKDEGEQK